MDRDMKEGLFVLRRAWLNGVCRRADVDRAFGTENSPNRGSNILDLAVRSWPRHLYRRKYYGVYPRSEMPVPEEAKAGVILDLLANGAKPDETGIFPEEGTPVLSPIFPSAQRLPDSMTQIILDAALHERPFRGLYVGLRSGETSRWRNLFPCGLEFTGLYWRLHAQDLNDEAAGYPIKAYVMARFLDAMPLDSAVVPPNFRRRGIIRKERTLKVRLSEDLTTDQEKAVCQQFDIKEGRMLWPDHALYDFRREYGREESSQDIVWPLFTKIEEME